MKLQYKAVGKDGELTKGILEAKDNNEAAGILRARGLLPVQISLTQDEAVNKYLPFLNKLNQTEVVFFTRQLSSMLSAGLTLLQSLNILRDQVQNPKMRDIINALIVDVQSGHPFSAAISKHPKVFSPTYISLIKTAESSGLLDKVLVRLADNLEKQSKLKGAIRGALTYPAIVVVGMVIVMIVMMIYVIPQLTSLYENLNIPLPATTQVLVNISSFAQTFWPLVIGSVVVGVIGFRRWRKTASGKVVIDSLILKLPVFGKLIRQTILTEFTRTLGLLIGSGALVVQSLEQASDTTNNILYKSAILDVSKRVEKGVTIGDALNAYSLFPPLLVQMVKIGEDTGKLDESLLKVSEYYEREVDLSVKTMTTALEPFIMVILGIGVAFLIVSIITPIYSLTSSIQ